MQARRSTCLREKELRKLGIAYKRARFFITCSGKYEGQGVDFSREALRAKLAAPIKGGNHGRRADKICPGQMSLFESVETPEKMRLLSGKAEGIKKNQPLSALPTKKQLDPPTFKAPATLQPQPVDGLFGWQNALEQPQAVCA